MQEPSLQAVGSADGTETPKPEPETAPPETASPKPISYGLPSDELPAEVKRAKPVAPIKVKPVKPVNYDHVGMALPSDENAIMELLYIRHEESGYGEFDDLKVRAVVRVLTQRVGGVIGVIRGFKRIEASIALVLDYPWFSSTPILRDLFCFVHPRYRKSYHQRRMLALAKDYATRLGVTLLMDAVGGVEIDSQAFGLAGLYRRDLGPAHAAHFVMRVPEDATV